MCVNSSFSFSTHYLFLFSSFFFFCSSLYFGLCSLILCFDFMHSLSLCWSHTLSNIRRHIDPPPTKALTNCFRFEAESSSLSLVDSPLLREQKYSLEYPPSLSLHAAPWGRESNYTHLSDTDKKHLEINKFNLDFILLEKKN